MKLTKQIINGTEVYFENGIEKYGHRKDSDGYEVWNEYDNKGNEVHHKTSDGLERWGEYDNKGNVIYSKDSDGEEWRKIYNPEEEVDIEPFIFKKD